MTSGLRCFGVAVLVLGTALAAVGRRPALAAPSRPAKGTLSVRSRPAAQVFLDGRVIGLTPVSMHKLKPGRYRMELRTTQGRSHYRQVVIHAGKHLGIDHRFPRPRAGKTPGSITVSSKPWSQVFINDRAVGNTPLRSYRLAPRSYVLSLITSDGRSYKRAVFVEAGRDTRVEHTFRTAPRQAVVGKVGWLTVRTRPQAAVYVDGRKVGVTPLVEHELSLGKHRVQLRTFDNRMHKRTIHVRRHKTVSFNYNFGPPSYRAVSANKGWISVTANQDAAVHIDGKRVGWTPLIQQPVSIGRHRVLVKSKDGQRRRFTFHISNGRTRTVHVRFKRRRR